jgi:hypothetical protein
MTSPSHSQSTTIRPTTSDQSPDVAADQSSDIATDQSTNVATHGRTDQTPDQSPDVAADQSPDIAVDQSSSHATDQSSNQSPDIVTDQSVNVATNGWTDNSNVESPVPSITSTNTSTIRPTTLSSILQLQALSSNEESPVLPSTMTNTSLESSEAVQQRNRRLRMDILESAIALLDSYDPIESSTTHQQLPQ